MAPTIHYRDAVKLFRTTKSGYGTDQIASADDYEEMKGLYVQVTNYSHSNNTDGLSSENVLHLPPDNEFLVEKGYRIEQMIVAIDPYGAGESYQYFRIASVNVARDVLLGNEVHNVECSLTKVAGLKDAS